MKFKTFRMVMMGGLLALLGSCGYWLMNLPEPTPDSGPLRPALTENYDADAEIKKELAAAPPVAQNLPAAANPGTSSPSLRAVDQSIMSLLSQPATSEKVKDVIPGPIKVSLYHDDKSGFYNRLKIDLNRNEKWDEKWTMKQGVVVKRQVAPADDENYTEEYIPEGGGWKQVK